MNHKSYYGIVMVAGILLALWGASTAGWFRFPDLILYDNFVRAVPEQKLATQKILLLEASPDDVSSGDSPWLSLNQRLQAEGAKQIVYSFVPRSASREFYRHAQNLPTICFGRRLQPDKGEIDQPRPRPLPKAARGLDLVFGVSAIARPDYGVYRFQRTHIRIGDSRLPTLVYVAATQRLGQQVAPNGRFFVNFNGKSENLPRLPLEKALSDQLIPELIEDKTILIGMSGNDYSHGLSTPINPNNHGLDRLTYQGRALETLISENTIHDPGPWIDLLCIAVVGVIGLIAYQVTGPFLALWFTGICLAVYLAVSWILLSFLLIWPPVFEIIVAQGLIFGIILRRRQLLDLEVLKKVFNRLSAWVRAHIIPEDFTHTRQHWSKITAMVSQTLNLSRSIFLETVEKDHRIREIAADYCSLSEIAADNCSIDDIREQRRDFTRTPYTTALSEKKPVQVENFLDPLNEQEIQYLVPLYFADQVMGFWAFSIHPEEYEALNNFDAMVYDYSHQIAELLYQQQKWQETQRMENRLITRFLTLKGGKTLPQSLHETYTLVEKKLVIFQSVLEELKTAIVVYDLFGQVIQINREMERTLRDMDLKPFESTAAELAARLSRTDEAEIRRQLNQVVSAKEMFTMPVFTTAEVEQDYLLSIRPVRGEVTGSTDNGSIQPFSMQGILFELHEITEFKDVCTMKDELLEDFHEQQREALETMATYLTRMERADIRWEDIKQGTPELKESINHFVQAKDKIHTYISRNLYTNTQLEFPIVPTKYLNQAIQRLEPRAQERQIAFDVQSAEKIGPVFAEPQALYKLFSAILAILLEDAAQQTTVAIEIEKHEKYLQLEFRNQGFGMPDETFQHYLNSPQAKASESFAQLKTKRPYLEQWDGQLSGTSAVGKGINFTLKLKTLN
ncbi:MAG: CHASE2 domain-containing protein [Desulfohalobiaceae bacterium]